MQTNDIAALVEALEKLRPLSDRATGGPWCWEQCGDISDDPVVGIAYPGDDHDCERPYSGEFSDADAYRTTIALEWPSCAGHPGSANAALAVAAVNFVRAALATAAHLEDEDAWCIEPFAPPSNEVPEEGEGQDG